MNSGIFLAENVEVCSWPPAQDVRYEIKFVAQPTEMPMLQAWLATNRCGWTQLHPDRIVNNVYLDTCDLQAYVQNQAGDSERRKLRFRWYGATWAGQNGGTLEVKCRKDSIGWKWNARVDWPFDLTRRTWQGWRDGLRPFLPGPHRMLLDARPMPALVNRYERSYFGSRDGKLRLTVDRNLQSWPQLGAGRPRLGRPAHTVDVLVIAIKCAVADRAYASDAMRDMPWRVGRNSKYALGVESIENL